MASPVARASTLSRSASSRKISSHGVIATASSGEVERCDCRSNARIDSTSSPKNSTRTGVSAVAGHTSRIPPRTAYSPAALTTSTRAYPRRYSRSSVASQSAVAPARRWNDASSNARRGMTYWRSAATGATITCGLRAHRSASSVMRALRSDGDSSAPSVSSRARSSATDAAARSPR